MRLTADLVVKAPVFVNCLQDRQLDLRGNKIPAIENLGVCGDQVDVLDFSDNEITKLENFPLSKRLHTLLLHNNNISSIDSTVARNVAGLRVLVLTNNRIAMLSEVDALTGLNDLEILSFTGNPICHRPRYRLYTIHKLPSVRVLDFRKVRQCERDEAARLFKSETGKSLAKAGQLASSSAESTAPKLTPAQATRVKAAIGVAKTAQDVELLAKMLKAGIIPDEKVLEALERGLTAKAAPAAAAAAAAAAVVAAVPAVPVEAVAVSNGKPALAEAAAAEEVVSEAVPEAAPVAVAATPGKRKRTSSTSSATKGEGDESTPKRSSRRPASPRKTETPAKTESASETPTKTPSSSASKPKKSGRKSKAVKAAEEAEAVEAAAMEEVEKQKEETAAGDGDVKDADDEDAMEVDHEEAKKEEEVEEVEEEEAKEVDVSWVSKLKVTELKAELQKLDLNTKGRKAELVKRLVDHLQSS